MRRFLLGVATMLIGCCNLFAWGPKGHDIVAYIAECNVSKSTLKSIEKVLDGESMVYVANWMDNASHKDEYAYTKTWHYVNVDPSEGSYSASVKDPKGDVVTAITGIVDRLKSGELTVEQERVELMMLIHLVGDMHCPMHAGRKGDRGGNGTQVQFFGKSIKLHSLWDSEIVESAHRWSYSEWGSQVDRVSKREKKTIVIGGVADWIEESVALASDVYENSVGAGNLSYDYVAHYAPIIESQLLKAGLRLAKLLEEIY